MLRCVGVGKASLSPFSLPSAFSLHLPLLRRPQKPCTYSTPTPSSFPVASIRMASQIVEHVVLFKVKPDADPSKVAAMVSSLNRLTSLELTLHLSAGPLHRSRSSSLSFTHILHSRYRSKSDLVAYAVHPEHVRVVTECVRPIVDDIMAVDWFSGVFPSPVSPKPGAAMRVAFLKLKENSGVEEKSTVLGVIGGLRDHFPSIDQISFGENFSLDRAKGYTIASLAILPGLSELEAMDSETELVNLQKERARELIESVVVVDYVVPGTQVASL